MGKTTNIHADSHYAFWEGSSGLGNGATGFLTFIGDKIKNDS